MNREDFLHTLRERLAELSEEDRKQTLEYYSESIADRMEEGLSEEEAVAALGSVEEIAAQILPDGSLSKRIRQRISPGRGWKTALLILGSPLWLMLLFAAGATVFAGFLTLWSIIAAAYAVALSAVCGTLAGVINLGVCLTSGAWMKGLFFLGAGMLCAGVSIAMFIGLNRITGGLLRWNKRWIRKLKESVIRKEPRHEEL